MKANRFKINCTGNLNKKSQLKIQEMSFMLVAVFLFFILVGLFAVSIIYKNIYQSAAEEAEEQAYASIFNLAESAEFTCGSSRPNCIDADKLIVLTDKSDIYEKFWPKFSTLKVISENGLNKGEGENLIECNLLGNYNSMGCDEFIVFDKNVKSVE